MPPRRIHHINFVVRDLEAAKREFETLFDLAPFVTVDHPLRGAHVARSKVGDSWIVLVCPYDPDSVPGRYLAEHGEGLFLLSLGVADFDVQLDRLAARDIRVAPRHGILDWRIADVGKLGAAVLQLSDDSD